MIRSLVLTKPEIAYMTDKEFKNTHASHLRLTRRELKLRKKAYVMITTRMVVVKGKGLQVI